MVVFHSGCIISSKNNILDVLYINFPVKQIWYLCECCLAATHRFVKIKPKVGVAQFRWIYDPTNRAHICHLNP